MLKFVTEQWCLHHHTILVINLGEFGIVYKANFFGYNNGRGSMNVAVKTIQGISAMLNSVIAANEIVAI